MLLPKKKITHLHTEFWKHFLVTEIVNGSMCGGAESFIQS